MLNIFHFLTLFSFFFSKYFFSNAKVINVNSTLSNILKLTGKTDNDLPSDYETIQIWYPKDGMSLQIHCKSYVSFYAFGKNITANMEPIQFNLIDEETPVWLGDWNNEMFTLKKLPSLTIKQEFLWYATSKNTVIGMGFDNGVPYFFGKIGNITVVPFNKKESQELRRRKRYIDNELLPGTEDSTGSFLLSDYHKIYISSQEDNVDFFDTIKTSLKKEVEMKNMKSLKRIKRDSINRQEIIRPKILLYVDYGSQFIEPKGLLFNRFIMYLISFWNNVNIYFQYLKDPRISLQITGIIIGMSDLPGPFLMGNHVGFTEIMSRESLINMNLWFNQHQHIISKDTYDIAITMTSRTLFQSSRNQHIVVDGAVKSSIDCQGNQPNMNVSAIIHDNKFSGISAAVEEFTYIMNAGFENLLRSHRQICNLNDGTTFYVQNSSYEFHYKNPQYMFWTNCYSESTCGYKKHFLDIGEPLPNILPEEITSLDEHCQLLGHIKSCKRHGYFDCNGFLWCKVKEIDNTSYFWNSEKIVCKGVGFILDGTSCGENKYCYDKKCVPYAQNIWIQNISD